MSSFFSVSLTIVIVMCLQVLLIIFKQLFLVEILPKNDVSLHGCKSSFIIPSGGEKHIISVFVVCLYRLLHEEFIPVAVPSSPLYVFTWHDGDEGDDDE